MDITKEYFDEQLKSLVTKDDLKNFATKDDLKSLAAKNDLDDIRQNVTDLKRFVQTNMVTKQELDDLREVLPSTADFNRLQQSADGIAKNFEQQRQEQIIAAARSERIEAWIIKAAEKIGVEYKP